METAAKVGDKRKGITEPQGSGTKPLEAIPATDADKQIVPQGSVHTTLLDTSKDQDSEQPKKKSKTSKSTTPPTAEFLTGHNLALVPPGIVNKLANAQIIGHLRPLSERIMDARFYEIDVKSFRETLANLLSNVLTRCYHDKGKVIKTAAATEISQVVPLTVDACMIAIYAKFRNIHKQYGRYSSRFQTPASYHKDLELPLPLADAISDFGVFETTCAEKCFIYVPVIPEGTKFECRSSEEWNSYKYESCIQIFKDIGIPCRNVDSRLKSGSAWWTYCTNFEYGMYSGTMVVPPLHYTDNSATIASMFLATNEDSTIKRFIQFKTDDINYGQRFQLLRPGVQVRAFMALIAKPDEDWNAGSTFE